MKLASWAFNNLSSNELLQYLLSIGCPPLDKGGADAILSLLESFCRRRGASGKNHKILWATVSHTGGRYLHYHSSRIFSKYPQYAVKYNELSSPPVAPDWILLQWIDGSGFSREVMRRLNICIRPSAVNAAGHPVPRRSSKHEDA